MENNENKNEFSANEFEEEAGMIIRADYIESEVTEEELETDQPVVTDIVLELSPKKDKKKQKKDPMKEILEWVISIVIAVVLTFFIKSYLFDFVVVDGQSMFSTLEHGERLVLTKLGYEPEIGDIIVLDAHYKARQVYFSNRRAEDDGFGKLDEFASVYLQRKHARNLGINKKYYVKRVIALAGDTVDIDPYDGTVRVNGTVIEEPYLDEGIKTPLGHGMEYPYTVEDGHVFVMGDNRANSLDSRYSDLGAVPLEAVSGKVSFRILPFNKFGGLYDYE